MSKKMFLITIALGLLSFTGAFVFAWFTKPSPEADAAEPDQTLLNKIQDSQPQQISASENEASPTNIISAQTNTKSMSEQQLKNLIHDLRIKMEEYDNKIESVKVREQRLQVAQDVIREDIENLKSLQIELASITADIKVEQDKLLRSKVEIEQIEQTNLVSIAATYDKMEASSASMILTNMCQADDIETEEDLIAASTSISFNDAVKILYYMTERTKAELLADMAISEPQLAAILSRKLKRIVEVN
ncbi:hypothetical protein ACFLZ8_02390 [Planctomycetota bacterium]